MKGKPGNGGELENKDLIPRVKPPLVGNTANSEISSISTRGGFKEMKEKVSVVYEGSSDNLQAAYRLLAEFFKEYLSENDQKQKVEGGDVH